MTVLSVIIPTYNRADRLQACLRALAHQTQQYTDFEVVVVVDGSTDETQAMLDNFTAPYSLRPVWQTNQGQCAALNRGAEEARGRYCLFLDDDMIAAPQLIAEHISLHCHEHPVVGIGQIDLNLPADADWFARCFAQGWRDHYARLNYRDIQLGWEDCYGGNMSVARECFLAVGGFSNRLTRGYDVELAFRLGKHGCTFAYLPQALAHQDERKSFRELATDVENAGRSDLRLFQDEHILSAALASFNGGNWRKLLLRRVFLALDIPPRWLVWLGSMLGASALGYSWYSFINNYCYWRGVRREVDNPLLLQQFTTGVPILMYHAFAPATEPASRYVMPIDRFARQMAWLKRHNYQVISLESYVKCLQEQELPPARSVVITIDDAYADNRTLAIPILQQYDYPVTLFVSSALIGGVNNWSAGDDLSGRPLMSWNDINELSSSGVMFGAHTRSHPHLSSLSDSLKRQEIEGSRIDLETELGKPIGLFAYPYGETNEETQALVEASGFTAACGVEPGLNGLNTSRFSLFRSEIYGTDRLWRFLLALWFGDAQAFFPRWEK